MHPLDKVLRLAACCVFAFGLVAPMWAQGAQVASSRDSQTIAASELPDSPGTAWAQAQSASSPQDSASQQTSSSQTAAPAPVQTESSSSSSTTGGQNNDDQKLQRPVGTAAAEAAKVKGVTAAQPAGVAMAPAKQRRVRTIVIKVGAIVAASAAIGTVIALTEATPSRPPGAH